jgi:hypothetical protein
VDSSEGIKASCCVSPNAPATSHPVSPPGPSLDSWLWPVDLSSRRRSAAWPNCRYRSRAVGCTGAFRALKRGESPPTFKPWKPRCFARFHSPEKTSEGFIQAAESPPLKIGGINIPAFTGLPDFSETFLLIEIGNRYSNPVVGLAPFLQGRIIKITPLIEDTLKYPMLPVSWQQPILERQTEGRYIGGSHARLRLVRLGVV